MTDQPVNDEVVEELEGEVTEVEELQEEFPNAEFVIEGVNLVEIGLSTTRKMSDDIYGSFQKSLYLKSTVGKKDKPQEILEKLSEKSEEWVGRSTFIWAQDADERKKAEMISGPPKNTGNQGFTAPASSPMVFDAQSGVTPALPQTPVPVQNQSDEVIFVSALRVWNIPTGGQGVKVMGAPYTKYGVTTYPEVYHTLGFHATGMAPGDYQMQGFQNLQAVISKKTITDQTTQLPKVVPDKVIQFINNGVAIPVVREG